MPKDLAALLVENGAVPADVVERAVARQQEAGGALDTALLELGALPEDDLAAWLSRAAELPPAPPAAWKAADPRARRVFPSRVAERHGLAPFALEGRELALVATYPVDLGLLDEISFMLSLHLTAHVGPEWRVRELIHRIYGTALPPRLEAIAEAVRGAAAGATGGEPARAAEPPAGLAEEELPGLAEALPPEPPPRPPPPAPGGFGADDEPMEPLAAALAQALESVEFDDLADEEPPSAGPAAAAPGEAEAGPPDEAPEDEEPAPPADRSAPPRWKLADALAAVAAARHRDDVVLAALRYARDFFEFAAMFAVTRDAVAGHDALGLEEARDRARSVAIWATDPGVFKTVIETQSPYLGPLQTGAAGTDAVLHALGRSPRTVLVYPIVLRARPVCVLYADNGEAPVSARRLGDLLLFLSTVGAAFERIIRDRKKRRRRRAAPAAVPVEAPPAAAAPEPEPEPEREPEAPPPVEEPPPPAREEPPPVEDPPPPAREEPPPAEEPPPPAAEPPAPPAEDEGALSFADLESQGAAEPAPPPPELDAGPEPEAEPAADAAGRTALLWPAARAPSEGAAPSRPAAASPADGAPPQRPAPPKGPPPVAAPPDVATLSALADRALDSDPEACSAACAALGNRRRDPAVRPAAEKLRRALLSGLSTRATRAARAIGALRDLEAIPLLIQVLETSDPETARAAADALAAITLQKLGPDARRWLAWWKENRGRGRAEWLFSALTSPDRDLRVAASLELSHAAPPPVAYTADMPAPDREKAARAWAGWWARSGHVL